MVSDIQTIVLDLHNKNNVKLAFKQVDENSRFLQMRLTNGGDGVDLTGSSVYIYVKKPDNTVVFAPCEIYDSELGMIIAPITQQMLALVGSIKCEILVVGNGKLSFPIFNLSVDDSIYDGDAVESSNEFSALATALDQVNTWDSLFEVKYDGLESEYAIELTDTKLKVDKYKIDVDTKIEQTNAQLSQKLNKNSVLSLANMGQDVKEAMTGGSVAVVGKDTVLTENIVDGQVTANKTSFLTLMNLHNKATDSIGKFMNSAEVINDNANYNLTDYISVEQQKTYVASYHRLTFYYDVNKTLLSTNDSATHVYDNFEFTTPANTKYIKTNITTLNNAYSNYYLYKKESMYDFTKLFGYKTFSEVLKVNNDKNYWTKFNYINGITVSEKTFLNADGTTVANENYNTTDFIEVQESQTYTVNFHRRTVFYNASKVVSGVIEDTIPLFSEKDITIPTGVKYIRTTIAITSMSSYYINSKSFRSYLIGNGDTKPVIFDNSSTPTISYKSVWSGKTFVSLGDSIMAQDGFAYPQGSQQGQIAKGFQTHLKNRLGFAEYTNKAVSGRPIASGTSAGDGTNDTSKTIDYTNFDLVTIAGGTNDFKLNVPLGVKGEIGDITFDNTTFYGAYREMLEYILTKKPTIRICLFTPLQRDNGGYNGWTYVNSVGCKLTDYVNAIKEVGKMYGIPVCDMYSNSGITKLTLNTYTIDGLHPNDLGYERYSSHAVPFVDSIGL